MSQVPNDAVRQPLDVAATSLMVALCFVWGLQQVAIKAVAADVAPVLQSGLRSGVAAALVWGVSRLWFGDRWLSGVGLRSGIVVGVLFGAEFLLVSEGLRWTTASHMGVFLYTAPMFAAIGLHLALPAERLSRLQWAGIGLAFAGIAVTFLGPSAAPDGGGALRHVLFGDLLGVGAGAAWGLTTVAIRTSRLSEAPPAQTLFYQLAWAVVMLLPFAVMTDQLDFHATALVWASLGFQTLVVAFVSYLLWFWLLRHYLAARLGVLSFMTPLFGVVLGAILLHEPLDSRFLTGAGFVLAGLLLVNGHDAVRRFFPRRTTGQPAADET